MNEQVTVSDKALGYLNNTHLWITFIAVMGFLGTALMLLIGLAMLAGGSFMPANSKMPAMFFTAIGVFYLIMSIFLCLIPGILLMRYGSAISSIPAAGQAGLESAMSRQKSFWKYIGFYVIAMVVFEVFFFIVEFKLGILR